MVKDQKPFKELSYLKMICFTAQNLSTVSKCNCWGDNNHKKNRSIPPPELEKHLETEACKENFKS